MTKLNGYVFTGGPGAGKTTVITALKEMGYLTVPESGRQIIREQVQAGGDALPWANKTLFRDKMMEASIRDFQALAATTAPVFFDRGIPGMIGYSWLEQLPVPAAYDQAARELRYNPQVFIFPPWEEIFSGDTERKQDFATAVDTYNVMKKVYTAYGYTLITVPMLPVADRVDFILGGL